MLKTKDVGNFLDQASRNLTPLANFVNQNMEISRLDKLENLNKNFDEVPSKDLYSRPAWRAGMRDKVWEQAKDTHGRVRDPVSGRYMSKDQPWDMGHKPGYEFKKHQESAAERGISREQFIDEYNNPEHLRPELPSSNRSHRGENKTSEYFGDVAKDVTKDVTKQVATKLIIDELTPMLISGAKALATLI